MNTHTTDQYSSLLSDISNQILQSRYRAAQLVNRELLEVLNVDDRIFDEVIV